MPKNQPTVSVIIPARDADKSLPLALESVARQSYPDLEVIVAAADEVTADVARSAGVTVVENPAQTTPVGLNLAFSASDGDVIVRCDAQSILPPDYVRMAVVAMERTGAAAVGGMQVPIGNTPWEIAIAEAMTSPLGAGDARYRIGGDEGPAETVYLGVYRRSAIEAVGGFDEEFVRTQDYELNHRLIESGEVVWFEPALRVGYRPRGSLRDLASQYFEYGRAKRQFSQKHPGSLRLRQWAAPAVLIGLTATLIGSIWLRPLLVFPGLYGVALIVAGMSSKAAWLRVASALFAMHVSWGTGFLLRPPRER